MGHWLQFLTFLEGGGGGQATIFSSINFDQHDCIFEKAVASKTLSLEN
jgi:hypothetical protein